MLSKQKILVSFLIMLLMFFSVISIYFTAQYDPDLIPLIPSSDVVKIHLNRGFFDDFSRSPGHGLGKWKEISGSWDIIFSFDPNRIPFQYALQCKNDNKDGLLQIDEPDWEGLQFSCSVNPGSDSSFGLFIDRNNKTGEMLSIHIDNGNSIRVNGIEPNSSSALSDNLQPDQWYRVTVRRWAWILEVLIDEKTVFFSDRLPVCGGGAGLIHGKGRTVFDDIRVQGIEWIADDGIFRLPWQTDKPGNWFRSRGNNFSLKGRQGRLSLEITGEPPFMVYAEGTELDGSVLMNISDTMYRISSGTVISTDSSVSGNYGKRVSLISGENPISVKRIAFGFKIPDSSYVSLGSYAFEKRRLPDPSDYLDFTDEEYRFIKTAKEADKLKRSPKYLPVISRGMEKTFWRIRKGYWNIQDGRLKGTEGSILQHAQEIMGEVEVNFSIRFPESESILEWIMYFQKGANSLINITRGILPEKLKGDLSLVLPDDDTWHTVSLVFSDHSVVAKIDGKQSFKKAYLRPDGDRVLVSCKRKGAELDDIAFRVLRRGKNSLCSMFDSRETDWVQEGGVWIDHSGIACALASSWISLVAPGGKGMLWCKREFGPSAALALSVGENSEWYGWRKNPSHKHFPYDNIRLFLGTEQDIRKGYLLEVNSKNRFHTVLYRNGEEVKRINQDNSFPMKYRGGHAPYSPRSNRIILTVKKNDITASVNGVEVLSYTDPDVIPVSKAGFGGFNTRINFSNVEIRNILTSKEK